MSHAYDRAIKNVPGLLADKQIDIAVETLGAALATEWREDLIDNLPESGEVDSLAFITDFLSDRGNEHKAAVASLLGWAAGVGGYDPIAFTESHSERMTAIFVNQLGAEIENVMENRPETEADEESIVESPVEAFFRSDEMKDFLEEHATGETPWNVAMDGNGRLVITDSNRSVFFTVAPRDTMFVLHRYDDAMDLIDTQSEKGELIANQYSPAAAFQCFLDSVELSPSSPSV